MTDKITESDRISAKIGTHFRTDRGAAPIETENEKEKGDGNGDEQSPQSTTSGQSGQAATSVQSRQSAWILGPVLDYLFVAGGAVWLLTLVNFMAIGFTIPTDKSKTAHLALIAVAYAGQYLLFNAHNIATHMRLWESKESRRRYRFYRTWLMYVVLILIITGVLVPQIIGYLIYFYMVSVFWHFCLQTCSITLLYCRKRAYPLSLLEKRLYRAFMLLLSTWVTLRFLTVQDFYPSVFYGVASPFWIPIKDLGTAWLFEMSRYVLVGVGLGCLLLIAKKALIKKAAPPLPAVTCTGTIIALGLAPSPLAGVLWFYVPAFFHASQYLALNLARNQERTNYEQQSDKVIHNRIKTWPALAYIGKAALIASLIYVIFPHCLNLFGGFSFNDAAALVFAAVNYHQFATDAAFWKFDE